MSPSGESISTPGLVPHPEWSLAARLGFRFAFIYWAIYCLEWGAPDLVLGLAPPLSRWVSWLTVIPLDKIALWAGTHLFHLSGEAATTHPTGSGDTALQWVLCCCIWGLALAGAAVWSGISEFRSGRGRREYRTLYAWLRLVLRFTLAMILLSYGFEKVFVLQFRPPDLSYLTVTYGESSPMRLLWTFIGASVPYTIFSGSAEVVPGLLLLFRRTSTLGALLSAGVLLNVVLLNFCYDVPVKLFSSHLLLASLFLLLPDARSLARIFLMSREGGLPGVWLPRWERRPLRWASHILQVLVIGNILYQTALSSYRERRGLPSGLAPLYGIWVPDKVDGLAPKDAWTKLIFERQNEVVISQQDGKRERLEEKFNVAAHTIAFPKAKEPCLLQWTTDPNGTLVLTGKWKGNPVTATLHKIVIPDSFLLETRSFHWVEEYPFNR
jgi:uncharacterized membrane protein YphA (DoxX/SURF4 family)